MNKDGHKPGQTLTFSEVRAIERKHRDVLSDEGGIVTREDIASMAKADVREHLDMYSADYDGRASIDDLRKLLTSIMFG